MEIEAATPANVVPAVVPKPNNEKTPKKTDGSPRKKKTVDGSTEEGKIKKRRKKAAEPGAAKATSSLPQKRDTTLAQLEDTAPDTKKSKSTHDKQDMQNKKVPLVGEFGL